MSISSLVVLAVFLPANQPVGVAGWTVPPTIDYRIDDNFSQTTTGTWTNAQDVMTPEQIRLQVDRACVAWSRVGAVRSRCRATGQSSLVPQSGTPLGLGDGLNFTDSHDGVYQYWQGLPPDPDFGILGSTWCDPYWKVPADQCDFYMRNDLVSDNWIGWQSFLDQTPGTGTVGINLNVGGALPGFLGVNIIGTHSFYLTAMHEVGHSMGLFHLVSSNGYTEIDTCDEFSYNCPVMSSGTQGRVSTWPQIDDWNTLVNTKFGMNERYVEYAIYDISSTGGLSRTHGWTKLKNSSNNNIVSYTPPRISCQPDGNPNGTSTCIVALGDPGAGPHFYSLNVSSSSVQAGAHASSPKWTEHVVDVAFGDMFQYLGLAKRPANVGTGSNIVSYSGLAGSITNPAYTVHTGLTTHTEPRIDYNEPSCSFLGAWPDRDGEVTLGAWDIDGTFLGSLATGIYSWMPAQVTCDSHLPGTQDCKLYVSTSDGSANDYNGRFQVADVSISYTSAYSCSAAIGRGTIIGVGPPTWSSTSETMLVDIESYGNGRTTGQLVGPAFLLTSDRFPYDSMGNSEVQVRVDSDGRFNLAGISDSTWSMKNTGAQGLSNATSWAWNEHARRFIVVRSGKEYL